MSDSTLSLASVLMGLCVCVEALQMIMTRAVFAVMSCLFKYKHRHFQQLVSHSLKHPQTVV